ncbi:hypothetical protein H0H92_000100 [Tricholoma furcatifolium]|nr:hypothetical protein H0H92_000100 [Tricholoma furcatifolium]
MVQLSAGICNRLAQASPDDHELFNGPHTVQFLSIKKVNAPNQGAIDRYRIIISDGINFLQAMLATQLNSMVSDATIGKHTVAVIEKLTCNYVQEKKLYIILALRVLEATTEKIGDPKAIDASEGASTNANTTPSYPPAPIAPAAASSSRPPVKKEIPVNTAPKGGRGSIFPIEGLSPYQNNWTIKARVTQKSDIRTWSNARGEGKLFNVTLMDDTGEIRATGFNLVVDELYSKLEEGKVYYISKARVNLAKKKFSNLANDYELSLERNTEVEECLETSNLPTIKYHFVPLNGLEEVAKDTTCDVIAIVKEVGPLTEIVSKQNRNITKRELVLVDQSGFSVRMTLWGKQAEQYSAELDSPVIAFKGAKVSDFGGRSLSMVSSSTMAINPDIEECFEIRGWYDSRGAGQSFQAQPTGGGGGFSSGFKREEMRCIADVKEAQLGQQDKVEYFSTRATIMHIKAENIMYPACPTPGCSKKVIDINGSWRCEKCSKSFDAPEYRYTVALAVADYSGQAWLQGFNDVGVAVFGMPAHELVEIRENNEARFNGILHKANCGTFNFACRAKQDEYNTTTDNMPAPVYPRRMRSQSPPLTPSTNNATPTRLKNVYPASPAPSSTSYTPTVTSGSLQQKLNIVTRVAIQGKANQDKDGATIRMYLKNMHSLERQYHFFQVITRPLLLPSMLTVAFIEENVKILTSQVHPLNNHSVPYNFSSTVSPLLHKAARALNLPARSTETFHSAFSIPLSAAASSVSSSRSRSANASVVGSENIPTIDNQYTGHILVSGYNVSYVLPKVFPSRPSNLSETESEGRVQRTRRLSIGDKGSFQFMAAIDMLIPYISRPPRYPYLLSIPVPRCLHNNIKLRIFPPSSASASFASLSSVEEDNSWDLTSDPHVTRSASRPSRSNSYSHFADDESGDCSTAGFSDGFGIQGTFPSTERIRVRWAKPVKTIDVPGGIKDDRGRVGVKEVKGEMTCVVRGKQEAPERVGVEGVLVDVTYKGSCRGVWFPGVATLLGLDVGLETKGSDAYWVGGFPTTWDVNGGVGYMGFDIGASPRQSGLQSRTASLESNNSNDPQFHMSALAQDGPSDQVTRADSSSSSTSSLLRAPLPAHAVNEYSFEGSATSLSSASSSALTSSVSSLPHSSSTESPPGLPITLHININEIIAPAKNVFTFTISGTILIVPRPTSSRLNSTSFADSGEEDENPDPGPVVLPRFTVLAADSESVTTTIRHDIVGSHATVDVYNPTGDYRDAQAKKTVLQKGGFTKCTEGGSRIALRSIGLNGQVKGTRQSFQIQSPSGPRTPTAKTSSLPPVSPEPLRGRTPQVLERKVDGPLTIPAVKASVTPLGLLPAYAVTLSLNVPAHTDFEWLEFGLAQQNSDGPKPPDVSIISAAVEGIPVRHEVSSTSKAETGSLGLAFDKMDAKEWANWVRIHVGAAASGSPLSIDYVVAYRDTPANGKGKSRVKDGSYDILLPSFSIPVSKFEVEIAASVDITSLRSNFAYQYMTDKGRWLLNYKMEPFFYPTASMTIRRRTSGWSSAIKYSLFILTWICALLSCLYVLRMNEQQEIRHTVMHDESILTAQVESNIAPEPITVTVTTIATATATAIVTSTKTTVTTVFVSSATTRQVETTTTLSEPSQPSLPNDKMASVKKETSSHRTDRGSPAATVATESSETPQPVIPSSAPPPLDQYALGLPIQHFLNITWPSHDLHATIDRVMQTLDKVWNILRIAYHYPLAPPE